MVLDNAEYEFAIATSSTDFDYDEVEEGEREEEVGSCCLEALRLTMQKLFELSEGDSRKLLCIFGGLSGQSYRELSKSTGMSHEWCRIQLLKLRESEIGGALSSANLISRLVVREKFYVITDLSTSKQTKVRNLLDFCRKMDWKYQTARSALGTGHVLYGNYRIERI